MIWTAAHHDRRRLAAAAVLCLTLSACTSGADDGALDAGGPAGAISAGELPDFPADDELYDDDELEMIAAEQFVVANPEVEALGTVAWISEATVTAVSLAPDEFPGAMLIDATTVDTVWADEQQWDRGTPLPVEPPGAGQDVTVMSDDIWQVKPGDDVLLAVAFWPNPGGVYNGFAEFIMEPNGGVLPTRAEVGPERRLLAGRLRDVQQRGARARGNGRVAAVELVQDARARIDDINRGGPGVPPGLLGDLVGRQRASEVAQGVPFIEQDPDWRQLPLDLDEDSTVVEALGRQLTTVAVLFDVEAYEPTPTFVGLQIPGVGLAGPVNVDPETGLASLDPYMPASGVARVLAWYDDEPDPDNAEVLGQARLPRVDAATEGLVVSIGSDVTAEAETLVEIEQRLLASAETNIGEELGPP